MASFRKGREAVPRNKEAQPNRLLAYVELLHLPPIIMVLIAATGFTIAAAGGIPSAGQLVPFLASIALTQLAISLHNDYCDRELDAMAKPWRAVPRGMIAPSTVLGLALALLALGILVATLLGPLTAALVAVGPAAGFAYNAWLKRSAWTWLAFWLGLPSLPLAAFAAVGRFEPRLWTVYAIGAPLALGIYLADTMRDIETDATHGVRGLAHRLGPWRARVICWGSMALALALALALSTARTEGASLIPTASATSFPTLLYAMSALFLALAVLVGWRRVRRIHWLMVMASAVTMAVGWIADVAGRT